MTDLDSVRRMTAELAGNARSLVFLQLAEALRRLGQLGAAVKVARTGLLRYPELADAHHLLARVLADQDDRAGAEASWRRVLELTPGHAGASKGMAFLAFRAGDRGLARAFLEKALATNPDDAGVMAALERITSGVMDGEEPASSPSTQASPWSAGSDAADKGDEGSTNERAVDFDSEISGALLFDIQGLRLAGRLDSVGGQDAGDAVAAHLAGVSREAARAARVLDLGAWLSVAAESADAHVLLVPPTPDTVLLVSRAPEIPVARLALLADQGARAARRWLERLG